MAIHIKKGMVMLLIDSYIDKTIRSNQKMRLMVRVEMKRMQENAASFYLRSPAANACRKSGNRATADPPPIAAVISWDAENMPDMAAACCSGK